jgi:hypothetical protein
VTQVLKQRVSRQVRQRSRRRQAPGKGQFWAHAPPDDAHFWQLRFYEFNVFTRGSPGRDSHASPVLPFPPPMDVSQNQTPMAGGKDRAPKSPVDHNMDTHCVQREGLATRQLAARRQTETSLGSKQNLLLQMPQLLSSKTPGIRCWKKIQRGRLMR